MLPSVESFLKLRPRLLGVREENGWIFALFDYEPKDVPVVALVTELYNDGVISEFRRGGQLVIPPELGDSGPLELRIDTGKLRNYFETYSSLIESNPDLPPAEYFVWEKNDLLDEGYKAACDWVQFLKSRAEVWDETGQRLFLVDQQAVEVPLTSYLAQQTVNLLTVLRDLIRFLDREHLDADARWAFFRKATLRLLRDLPKERRLGILMENLAHVFDRAKQDHSLYLERFSFEDLLRNFDEKRLKFVGDLNQILASIQTALVAVPIGFFLIAEKFKPSTGWAGQNIVLAIGGVAFFALIFVLSLNQGKTLQGIELALSDFETDQKKKITDKSERLKKLLTDTWSQFRRVRSLLRLVRFLLVSFSTLIVVALLWCSIPAWQKALPYVPKDSASPPSTNAFTLPKTPLPRFITKITLPQY